MNIIQGNDYLRLNSNKLGGTQTVSEDLLQSMNSNIIEGFSSCKKTQKYPDVISDSVISKNGDDKDAGGYQLSNGDLDADKANKEDANRYDNLSDELMRLIAMYKDVHGKLVDATDDYLGERGVDKNVYAGFIDKFSDKPKYQGCFRDSSNRAIPTIQRDGNRGYYRFDVEKCAQRAWDKGHTVFGMQNIQGNDTERTTCWTGTDLDKAKKYGEGIDYSWTWAGVQRMGWSYSNSTDLKLQLFPNGNLVSYTGKKADSEDDFNIWPKWSWWTGWSPGFYAKDGRRVVGQTYTDKFSFYRWWWWWRRGQQYYGGGKVNYLDRQWVGGDFWSTGLSGVRLSRPSWWSINYWVRASGSKAIKKNYKDKYTDWTSTKAGGGNNWDTRQLEDIPIKCDDGYVLQGYHLNSQYGKYKTKNYTQRNTAFGYGVYKWMWGNVDKLKSECDKDDRCNGVTTYKNENYTRNGGEYAYGWLGSYGADSYSLSRYSGTSWAKRYTFHGRKKEQDIKIRYWYRCAKWDGSLQCRQTSTSWNDSGGGNTHYLDRHPIYCKESETISDIRMENSDDRKKYRFNFSCCKNSNVSGCYLIIQNDGNLVIYKGTSPQDNRGQMWATNTSGQTGNLRVQEWLDKRKNGKNYIRSGEFLKRGEFIASDNGMVRAQLQNNGNFVVRRALSNCMTGSDKKRYGKGWANSVYTIPKNNVDDINKAVYIDKEKNVTTIPSNMLEGGLEFTKIPGMDSTGHDISQVRVKDRGGRFGTYDCQSYINRYPDLQRAFGASCEDPETARKAKEHWEKYGKREGRNAGKSTADPYECEKACIEDPNCGSFVMKDDLCMLKNNNAFPKGDRIKRNGHDLYIRSKSANNDSSCTSKVEAVSTTNYSSIMKGMANGGNAVGTMRRNTACGLKRDTSSERKNLQDRGRTIEIKIEQILAEMDGLTKAAQRYMAQKPLMKQNVSKMIEEYKKSFKDINKYKKSKKLLTQYEENTDLLMTSNNYKYVMWSVGAIVTLIVVIQIMKNRN